MFHQVSRSRVEVEASLKELFRRQSHNETIPLSLRNGRRGTSQTLARLSSFVAVEAKTCLFVQAF